MFSRPKSDIVESLLNQELTPSAKLLHRRLVADTTCDFRIWQRQQFSDLKKREKHVPKHARKKWREDVLYGDRRDPQRRDTRQLLEYLVVNIGQELRSLDELHQSHDEYRRMMSLTPTEFERQRVMLEFAKRLGAAPSELRADSKAISRWLTADVLTERFSRRTGETEHYLVFAFNRLAHLVQSVLRSISSEDSPAQVFKRLDIERLVVAGLSHHGDPRVTTAVLDCLSQVFSVLSASQCEGLLAGKTHAMISRIAGDTNLDVWMQSAAIELLARIDSTAFERIAITRVSEPLPADDLFVRRRIVNLLPETMKPLKSLQELIPTIARDPSPFVRQELARTIWRCGDAVASEWTRRLATDDPSPQVRAAVIVESLDFTERRELWRQFLLVLRDVLTSDQDVFVRRVALHVVSELTGKMSAGDLSDFVSPTIETLRTTADHLPLRRWAADVSERIWCATHPPARSLYEFLKPYVANLDPGQGRTIPTSQIAPFSDALIGRVLAVLAQNDLTLELRKSPRGYRLTRGTVYRFRWWRLLHELRHPATDKRQAFRHTVGRGSCGDLHAPSGIMAEMSQTKVPGEPLMIASDGTWRPFLPLVDDFLSLLDLVSWRRRTVRFFTSAGVTIVKAPANLVTRLRAFLRLTDDFPRYAQSRNWDTESSTTPDEYIRRMQQLGFDVRFEPHATDGVRPSTVDSTIARFFPGCLAVFTMPRLETLRHYFERYTTYFTSAFENTLNQLAIFIGSFLLFLIAKHAWANHRIRRARRAIPLCVGGWGTRGKSGTERLKAALFNSLGAGVFSKSTGCEAMFLHSHSHGRLREIPLFRPYDKATIWEHADVLRMASRLRPSVFLWECMGLTPDYVNVLQHQWTRDDVSTITNAYPDHEDIQGPAGHDVARVISGFVPRQARLLTTEQQMRPLIADSCRRNKTSMRAVGWLESGLITDDILGRFPYREHPDNIALVLALADELDCPRDFALKAMADDMVPDLGVLKTYPPAEVRSRTLEFTNGMSANERFGCLGNWKRLEFDQHDPAREPGVWICSVVNNRADRVARSRVFAQVLVKDLQADRHFLIGTNLKGLSGFIWESWDEESKDFTLWPAGKPETKQVAIETLVRMSRRFRQAVDENDVRRALTPVLESLFTIGPTSGKSPTDLEPLLNLWRNTEALTAALKSRGIEGSLVEETRRFADELLAGVNEYSELRRRIEESASGRVGELDQSFRDTLRTWFARKIVVIEDSAATGEQVIHRICQETPPGYRNRLMGIQNIKGTGMDFVQTWQTWDEIYAACQLLISSDRTIVQAGLRQLSAIPALGQLSERQLRTTIERTKHAFASQRENLQAELDELLNRLEQSMRDIAASLESTGKKRSTLGASFLKALEGFLDTQDAIRRRQTANQIYRDLESERISPQRAVVELRNLNKRQKGGWLKAPWS